MKIGFYLAHPAHFHLFKNVISNLRKNNIVFVAYNNKDVLHDLVIKSEFAEISHLIKTNKKVSGKFGLVLQFAAKNFGAYKLFKKEKADIIVGTPILIALLSKILPFKSIIVNEDDFDIIKRTADFGYPYAHHILAPAVCRTTAFGKKTIKYEGYHELAYLHPNHFSPDINIVNKYFNGSQRYFILRFAKLAAHHDSGIKGISDEVAKTLIKILSPLGKVLITSERELGSELEPFRIQINPIDMHHVMAFCSIYVGDSQTMAAEAGVLGVPFIRYNDFVGRISYLDELENKYQLGFGIKPDQNDELHKRLSELLVLKDLKGIYQGRRENMLNDKIDLAKFLTWFLGNYPTSLGIIEENKEFINSFRASVTNAA